MRRFAAGISTSSCLGGVGSGGGGGCEGILVLHKRVCRDYHLQKQDTVANHSDLDVIKFGDRVEA